MAESLFELNQISYSYTSHSAAIAELSLNIKKGDRVAIIGANGTGKSTLLAVLDALIFPQKGELRFMNQLISESTLNDPEFHKFFRRSVGFVFQNPDIQLFCPTIREDILFGPQHLGLNKSKIKNNFDKVIDLMKIQQLLDRSPHQLSIGEKKKVALASVLIIEPDVLLLDEPTAGLDPQTIRDIIAVLVSAHESGKTVVMATHDLHIVEEIADIIHVFGSNRTIIRTGPTDSVLGDDTFLRENNLIHIHVHRHVHSHHTHAH